MTRNIEIIVLNTTKFSDTAVVLHTLSREYGKRSFLVRGLGKNGRRLMTLFLPMNLLECEVTEDPRSRLWNAGSFTLRYPLEGIRGNLYKNTITLFLSEMLFKSIREEAVEEGLYEWCEESTLLLDALEKGWGNFHLVWLLQLAVKMGFAPESADLAPFAGEDFSTIEKLLKLPVSEALMLPLSGKKRNEIAGRLIDYIAFHNDSAININSLAVLREVFA